ALAARSLGKEGEGAFARRGRRSCCRLPTQNPPEALQPNGPGRAPRPPTRLFCESVRRLTPTLRPPARSRAGCLGAATGQCGGALRGRGAPTTAPRLFVAGSALGRGRAGFGD